MWLRAKPALSYDSGVHMASSLCVFSPSGFEYVKRSTFGFLGKSREWRSVLPWQSQLVADEIKGSQREENVGLVQRPELTRLFS